MKLLTSVLCLVAVFVAGMVTTVFLMAVGWLEVWSDNGGSLNPLLALNRSTYFTLVVITLGLAWVFHAVSQRLPGRP
ncbi:hypothetical protein KBB76_03685 [Candidatus Saccharibacteria bacterium]|jgi:uncharacterized BrkB/YihY/UPF0761 family membrane protein|nr:hypothetical protein [Candidatus Saccharibacteria bacterium]HOR23530.1 hypothetical protein [Candidatus Saccharibacteria bacterium]HPW48227.1 hypothetical protein [Candidatus Saccharibacteria bacterium]